MLLSIRESHEGDGWANCSDVVPWTRVRKSQSDEGDDYDGNYLKQNAERVLEAFHGNRPCLQRTGIDASVV